MKGQHAEGLLRRRANPEKTGVAPGMELPAGSNPASLLRFRAR